MSQQYDTNYGNGRVGGWVWEQVILVHTTDQNYAAEPDWVNVFVNGFCQC